MNCLPQSLAARALAATSSVALTLVSFTPAQAVIVHTGASGRFVAITNNAPAHALNLGELEAFTLGTLPNGVGALSSNELTGLSFESQVAPAGVAHGANTAPVNNSLETAGAVYTLNSAAGNQLIYDLGATQNLGAVRLWARPDVCCPDRLSNFTMSVMADNGGGAPGATVFSESFPGTVTNSTYAEFSTITARQIQPGNVGVIGTDVVNDNAARFLRVSNNGTNWLGIGEIEAFAAGVTPSAASGLSTNEMTGLTVESRVAPGGIAHGAITAPINNTLDSAGAVHTHNSAAGNEFLIDLGGSFDVGQIRLFNRTDCCQDRLANYTVSLLNDDSTGLPGNVIFSQSVPGQTPNTPAFTQINAPALTPAFTLQATDTLVIDIDPGTITADLLSIGTLGNGALTIQPGADLVLNFLNDDFDFGLIETYNILDFATVSGSFSSITAVGLDDRVLLDTSNLLVNGTITTTATPEPASLALWIGLGVASVLGLSWHRRRRRN